MGNGREKQCNAKQKQPSSTSTREFQYLATNLPPERYSVYEVAKAYHLRWQVELLFKEWKSYANLHAFDTQNPWHGGFGLGCSFNEPNTPCTDHAMYVDLLCKTYNAIKAVQPAAKIVGLVSSGIAPGVHFRSKSG
jgi:hypothetical protein